ncbi:NAD(P)/FAD-dependent oxidoreductase [Catenuloplanes japonicus]|uniref:NAD(P)/FAD-dependent oxidoreductase n=1 Tax=Catenuloplanes japonicus TaxID=33876 RepID=UPI0005246854|nr:FAD-dependent oxidoreductase [Catenuloplanes japonicus]
MTHRIVVLGAGYTGVHAAGRLARRLHAADTSITLVNQDPDFIERVRLHQLAAGQDLPHRPLRDVLAGTHVTLRPARVTALDVTHRTVTTDTGDLRYDTLVYALGSTVAAPGPDVDHVGSRPAALRLRSRLEALTPGATVLVAGGGLTAIEAATEIAESHPALSVAIAARDGVGTALSPRAQAHLRAVLAKLGITVHSGTSVVAADGSGATLADGRHLPADVTVWTTGFATHPLAAASGLSTAPDGRIIVDATMRAVSHPDVYAVGDAAHAPGPDGTTLRMSCASGLPSAWQAADAISARLTGRPVPTTPVRYYAQCISLGRHDGIIQLVTADDRPRPTAILGTPAARIKEMIAAGAAWSISHPTLLLPTRRHPLTPAPSPVA